LSEEECAAPESVTQLLGEDHHRLDALLADSKRLIAAGDLAGASARFAVFHSGLERHIVAEEELLFPAFEALAGIVEGPTRLMRLEHAEIRRLLSEVACALDSGAGAPLTTTLAALTARLYAHNGKEERILYPATDRAAREAGRLDALVSEIRDACAATGSSRGAGGERQRIARPAGAVRRLA
jgi:iron-sulfur cluster repair protein YtfE (RIC family)